MGWGEALRLTEVLTSDTSTQVCAAVQGWQHPATQVAIATWNLYDLLATVAWRFGGSKGRRPTPHTRPWVTDSVKTSAPAPEVTQKQILAALRAAGHDLPVPT